MVYWAPEGSDAVQYNCLVHFEDGTVQHYATYTLHLAGMYVCT